MTIELPNGKCVWRRAAYVFHGRVFISGPYA